MVVNYTLRTMIGDMDDNGLFPGLIKLAGAGGRDPVATFPGIEKSSISLFNTIPVLGDIIFEPKYELTVVVIDTALL